MDKTVLREIKPVLIVIVVLLAALMILDMGVGQENAKGYACSNSTYDDNWIYYSNTGCIRPWQYFTRRIPAGYTSGGK